METQLWYKGHDYWTHGSGFTVFWCGEELFFDTEEAVHEFIDQNF